MLQGSTRTGKPHNPKAPRYADAEISLLHRFLAACLTTAEHALKVARDWQAAGDGHPYYEGQVRHWRGVCAGIRWAAYKACERQPHLVDSTDEELNKNYLHFCNVAAWCSEMDTSLIEEFIKWRSEQQTT
jgi:hypothetical protein